MSIVSTRTEAIAEMNTHDAPFDIEMTFRMHYDRVTRIIRRVVADLAPGNRAVTTAQEVFGLDILRLVLEVAVGKGLGRPN